MIPVVINHDLDGHSWLVWQGARFGRRIPMHFPELLEFIAGAFAPVVTVVHQVIEFLDHEDLAR